MCQKGGQKPFPHKLGNVDQLLAIPISVSSNQLKQKLASLITT